MQAQTLPTSITAPLAFGELRERIRQALNERLTGAVLIHFQAGKVLTLLVQHGQVRQIYVRNHRLPDLNWELPLARYGAGTFESRPLPARALMFRKIVLEELNTVQTQSAGMRQLPIMFDLAEKNAFPTLFHIHRETMEGFVLVAGRNISLRWAVIAQAGTQEGTLALNQILAGSEAPCMVTIYRGDIKNQAWLEVHLNILLEWYCHNILKYYGQLTGTVMVRSVLQKISRLAEQQGWNVSTQDHQLRDTSLFLCATEAGEAYREILSTLLSNINPIIGSSLTGNVVKQLIESTRDIYRTVNEAFGLLGEVRS